MLVFKQRFIEPILSCQKTVTRRTWKRQLIREGSIQTFGTSYTNDGIFCKARILKVERGRLGEVKELEARREGFQSLDEFKDYFGEKWSPKQPVWVIRFEVIQKEITDY
ncbi:MAG: ASCH domain-containing protein [Nitrososphaerales archaeon]